MAETANSPWADINSRLYGAVKGLGQFSVPDRPDNLDQTKVQIRLPGRQTVAEPINPGVNPELTNVPDEPIWQKAGSMLAPAAQAQARKEVYQQPADIFTEVLDKEPWEGATVLSIEDETKFRDWMTQHPYYSEFQKRHGRVPNMDDPDYDYRGLWKAYGPEKAFGKVREADGRDYYHGWSRAPDNGKWLKNPQTNPTAWMQTAMGGLNRQFLAEKYGITDDDQLHDAISEAVTPEGRAEWARIYQESIDYENAMGAKKEASEKLGSDKKVEQPNYDKLSFAEARKRAESNPDVLVKGRFMWRGRPYSLGEK